MPLWMCVLIGILSAALDWSGIGPNAFRDRIAAIGYLAAAMGWFNIIGLSQWEETMHSAADHNTRVLWSMASTVPMFFWIGAMLPQIPFLGKFAQLSFRNGRRPGGGGARSGPPNATPSITRAEHINTWLLAWTVGVAVAMPLAMPSQYHNLVVQIAAAVTAAATSVGQSAGSFFGWN